MKPQKNQSKTRDDGGQRRAGAQANETPAQAEEAGPSQQGQLLR